MVKFRIILKNLIRIYQLKHTDSNDHQHGWDTKGENVALLAHAIQLPEPRRQDRGNHGAKIDGSVEYSKECGDLALLLWKGELLGAKRHDAWFDSSGSKCDEDKSQTRYRSERR